MPRGAVTDGSRDAGAAHRMLLLFNHFLHWASAIIVMSIAAYFISKYHRNQHLTYWVTIAAIDAFLYLPAMLLPAIKSYKGYLAPLPWIYSYLWLTAFIFAAQDYNWRSCSLHSPGGVGKCSLKKTLEAFAFLAFITNLVGATLEWRLWDRQRFKGTHGALAEKADRHSAETANTGVSHPAPAAV